MASTASANDDLKLQVATQYCSKGRQAWSNGNHTQAIADFQHALLILETLLGSFHILVAQLYQWMGLVLQEQLKALGAEQCFVRCLRIRYARQRESGGPAASDSATMEAQVALSNLWQARGTSSSRSFELIHNLQQSVCLEEEGDDLLFRDGQAHDQITESPNFLLAMKIYQQAMNTFPDERHEAIMSKMAMCYHKTRGSGSAASTFDSARSPNCFLDQAVVWYRMALKVFCTSCRFSEAIISPTDDNHSLLISHPEYQRIQQNLEKVLHDYNLFDFAKIKLYLEQGNVRKSVLHQYTAEEALASSKMANMTDCKPTATKNVITGLKMARQHYQDALTIERALFQQSESKEHMVVSNLQRQLSALDREYILLLEEERGLSIERLQLLEHQSSDWISTVRHQENQLQQIQSSLQNRESHAAEALNSAASKEAELVGWKRKFETMQSEWKESQKRVQALETEKAVVQQMLKQTENKASQIEYTLKKQSLDFENFQETMRRKTKGMEDWKEQYHAALQAQNHSQQRCERSEAMERELRAQIKDIQSQNVVLKDWNKELQTSEPMRSIPVVDILPTEIEKLQTQIQQLQTKLSNVTTTKDRAIKKLKKYHHQRQQKQGGAEEATEVIIFLEDKIQSLEREKATLEKMVRGTQQSSSGSGDQKRSGKTLNSSGGALKIDSSTNINLAARLQKSNDALATLHAQHSEKIAKLHSLEKSKQDLIKNVADSQEIIEVLKKANNEQTEKIDELKVENDRLKSHLNSSDSLLSKSLDLDDIVVPNNFDTETSNMLIDQVADLELQNEELREQLDNTKKDNQKLAMAVKSLQSKLLETTTISSPGKNHTRSLGTIMERITASDAERSITGDTENLERRLVEAEQANEDLGIMVEKMREQIKDLTSPVHDDSSGRSSVRATVLETELKEAKHHIDVLSANAILMQKTSDANKKILEEKEGLKLRINQLEEDLKRTSTKEKQTSGKLKEIEEKLKAALSELEEKDKLFNTLKGLEKDLGETSSHRESLLSENASFKKQLDSALAEIKEKKRLTDRCTQLEVDLRKSEEHATKLLAEMQSQTAKSAGDSKKVEHLSNQISKLKEELLYAQQENNTLTKQVASFKDELKSSRHDASEENIRLLERCSALEQELDSARVHLEDFMTESESQKHSLNQRCLVLEDELTHAKEKKETISSGGSSPVVYGEKDHKQLKERCMSLEKRLHEAIAQNQKISTEADLNSKGLAEMLAKKSQEQQRLVNERAKLEKKLHKSCEQKEHFAAQVEALSNQVVELQAELDTIESDHLEEQDDLVRRCHELEQKLHLNLESGGSQHIPQNIEKSTDMEREIKELIQTNSNLEAQVAMYQKKIEERLGNGSNEKLEKRCTDLEQELLETAEQNRNLAEQVDALGERVCDLQMELKKASSELETAQGMVQTLEARETPADDDFARLLERCTDLEAEKASVEYELKQLKGGSAELDEIVKEKDKLQQELDSALADLVELQQVGRAGSSSMPSTDNEELNDRLEALADAKDELKRLLDEAIKENADLVRTQKKMSETVSKAQHDRDNADSMFQQAKQEAAEIRSQMIAFEELLKESKTEGEELARQLEIEKQVSSSRKAAASSEPDEENELEDLYRQAREEMKELEEMLLEAEEQIEHLKTKCEKLEQKTELSRQDFIDTELSSETVHSLNDLSREELIKENRKVLRKLQETRTHAIDQQENITILQAQLRDALKFHQSTRAKKAPPRNASGGGGFGALWNRVKKEATKKPEDEATPEAEIESPQDQ